MKKSILMLFLLTLFCLSMNAQSVVRGPYLQSGTQSSITVKWRTSSSTDSKVWYGDSPTNLNQSVSEPGNRIDHGLTINGLSHNTQYYYAIGNNAGTLAGATADHHFVTSPLPGTAQPIRAWVLGDCGTGNNNQRAVRDAYYNYVGTGHTDMTLLLGDNAYNDGTDSEYQNAIFENMYEDMLQKTVTWSCPGNHDYYGGASSANQTGPYYDIFSFPKNGEAGGLASGTESYYSWDYGNTHFISLDSYDSGRGLNDPQLIWLENDLGSTTQEWIVVIFHHPPYTKGSHDSDNTGDSGGRMRDMRENVLPILENHGVDLVLSGHSHSYERSYLVKGHYGTSGTLTNNMILDSGDGRADGNGSYQKQLTGSTAGDGAVYITAGSSGKISSGSLNHPVMYYSSATLGSLALEIDDATLNLKFINSNGQIDDYFTIYKNDATGCPIPGALCDDQDPTTGDDQEDGNCNCAGTPCPVAGTACDDLNPNTNNDVEDGFCGCAGAPCPTAGTACNDGDPDTSSDVEDGFCNCAGTPDGLISTSVAIGSGSDDVEQSGADGSIYVNSSDIEMVYDSYNDAGNQTIGLRFNNIAVPQGADIIGAYIQFTVDEANTGTTNLSIHAHDTDDAAPFSSTAYDVSNRPATSATVNWSPSPWNTVGDAGVDQRTTNLKFIVQEIVDRSGYSNGNSMVFVIYGTGERTAEAYEGTAAAELHIDYVIPQNCDPAGTVCDDNDASTHDDIEDGNCNCAGTPCPAAGTTCDDGDPNTVNDVEDGLCNCIGFVCDVAGSPCDDGDPTTTNDIQDGNCNCSGTPCPVAGTSCDDGDPNSINDVEDGFCNCAGTVCDAAGTACDDGDPSTENDVADGNCGCAGTPCPTAGTACNDNNPNTDNDVEDGQCNCAGTPNTPSTVSIQIETGNDDVEQSESTGSVYLNSSDIEMIFDSYDSQNNQTVGLRFNNIGVPQAATIVNAYIQFTVDEEDTGTANLTIHGEDADNAAAFSSATNNVSNRNQTSASASWSPADWTNVGAAGTDQQTSDLSTIVQEIVDRQGYAASSSMAFIITGAGTRTAEAYEGSSSSAARLIIDYFDTPTCPAAGTPCDDNDPTTENDVADGNCGCTGTACPTAGTSCDDNDPATENDVQDGQCNCAGTPCATAGTSCDDNDPSTENDVADGNCGCAGTPCATAGTSCDDNDPTTENDVADGNCGCAGTACPTAGTSCDDNDPATENDVQDGQCNCAGTPCATAGTSCDDNDPSTENDVEDGNCGCAGTPCIAAGTTCDDNDPSTENDVEDGNCNCVGTPCPTAGTSCDDNDISTENDVQDGNCNCAGTPCDVAGTSCDDSDPSTYNDIADGNCGCAGTPCIAAGTACDDGDTCTINDVEDGNCNCSGTYTDEDADGFCIGEDPNDNDECVPDDSSTSCSGCEPYDVEDFENGWGIWNDGGSDARRNNKDSNYANSGTYCIRLRDNTSTSVMTTDNIDVSNYGMLSVSFSFIASSMENNEDFWIQISIDGGSSFTTVKTWTRGVDLNNGVRYNETVNISGMAFTPNTKVRFRCDASGNGDHIFIDDVSIEVCDAPIAFTTASNAQASRSEIPSIKLPVETVKHHIDLYPNPVNSTLNFEIESKGKLNTGLQIFNIKGQLVLAQPLNLLQGYNETTMDVSSLPDGMYFVSVRTPEGIKTAKFVKTGGF